MNFTYRRTSIITKKNFNRRKFAPPFPTHVINQHIPHQRLFLLNEEKGGGEFVSKEEALKLAKEKELDLVLISVDKDDEGQEKPIVRILDLGRYKYAQKKREREKTKKIVQTENKEIRITPTIALNDLKTKAKKAREFLLKGDRVKVTLRFRGREVTRKDFGLATLNAFFKEVEDVAKITKEPKPSSPRLIHMLLEWDKKKLESYGKRNTFGEDSQPPSETSSN